MATKSEIINSIKARSDFFTELSQKPGNFDGIMKYSYVIKNNQGEAVEKTEILYTINEGEVNEECIIAKSNDLPDEFNNVLNSFIHYNRQETDIGKEIIRFTGITYDSTANKYIQKTYFASKINNIVVVAPLEIEADTIII